MRPESGLPDALERACRMSTNVEATHLGRDDASQLQCGQSFAAQRTDAAAAPLHDASTASVVRADQTRAWHLQIGRQCVAQSDVAQADVAQVDAAQVTAEGRGSEAMAYGTARCAHRGSESVGCNVGGEGAAAIESTAPCWALRRDAVGRELGGGGEEGAADEGESGERVSQRRRASAEEACIDTEEVIKTLRRLRINVSIRHTAGAIHCSE